MNFLITFHNWDDSSQKFLTVFFTGTEDEAMAKAREIAERAAVMLPFGWDVTKVEVLG